MTDAESTLCYDGSYALLKIFWVLCVVCLAFVLLMLTANKGSKLLTDYQNIEIVKQLNLKKKRYANEILIEWTLLIITLKNFNLHNFLL